MLRLEKLPGNSRRIIYDFLVQNNVADCIIRYGSPASVNYYAVALIQNGSFGHAEEILKGAFSKLSAPGKELATIFEEEHYIMMLAVALQPGRQAEAYNYREQHVDIIAGAEAKYADLSTRLRLDEKNLTTYEEAKTKIKNG